MATLELQGLTKRFGEFTAVDSMNLKAAEGEMIALLGGSGCGKTTTLRMIASSCWVGAGCSGEKTTVWWRMPRFRSSFRMTRASGQP